MMDVRAANGPPAYRHLSGNAEVDIDRIVAAVAVLNDQISRLREEIDAFKSDERNDRARDRSR